MFAGSTDSVKPPVVAGVNPLTTGRSASVGSTADSVGVGLVLLLQFLRQLLLKGVFGDAAAVLDDDAALVTR